MKLGEVLRKERERKSLSLEDVAERMQISVEALQALEAGANHEFENAGGLLLQFNQLIEGQVSQIFYPCGLPFQELDDYPIVG
ncbi:MAG: helix-turn-helix domain-containing protein [Acidobacteriota bacterium]